MLTGSTVPEKSLELIFKNLLTHSTVFVLSRPEVRFQVYCSREYTEEEIAEAPKSILLRSTSSDDMGTPPRVCRDNILIFNKSMF